jgi:cysteine desulfurase/selenocysteine lyase
MSMAAIDKHAGEAEPGSFLSGADVAGIREEFPILALRRNGKPIIYFDNAATSQKPHRVICALDKYYTEQNANVHRGVHYLSETATAAFECARKKVQRFLNAPLTCEIVFTRGTTEAINLVAQTYGRQQVGAGDEVLISYMEHHSNIVPWQMLCEERGAVLRVAPINERGELVVEEYERLLNEKTRVVALSHVSNALGTINPVKKLTRMAHDAGAAVLLDGAQAAPHLPVDVTDLDCDFFACSGHKMYGPTGIGVLYGRANIMDAMPPYQGGGDMILSVSFEKTKFNTLPHKFEAGTPNIAGAIGLGAAIEFMNGVGLDRIAAYERELTEYGMRRLNAIDGVRIIGEAEDKAGVLSFTMDAAHPHDIGQILDDDGIAVRAGHHCAQPVMEFFGVPATARASLAVFNTKQEIDALAAGIQRIKEIFE